MKMKAKKEYRVIHKYGEEDRCSICNLESVKYNKTFDALYCENCNQWLEPRCPDNKCIFCNKRPNQPMKINLNKKEEIESRSINNFKVQKLIDKKSTSAIGELVLN